jgi:hypothetical protein
MLEIMYCKMELSVLIREFKLRAFKFSEEFFSRVKIVQSFNAVRAIIIRAFMDDDLALFFPDKESILAIRAEII